MLYLVKTPWWIKRWLYPDYLWNMPGNQKKIYLTFDDGPHPEATTFILDELKKYQAAATFFCIGKNVMVYPDIYKRILTEGHATGNHTNDHLNGWKTKDQLYFENIIQASRYIDSKLFRPPYGRITRFQAKQTKEKLGLNIVMWSVLSGDFDIAITPQKCWKNVRRSAGNGAVIVFHDSEKAMERMKYALTETLSYFSEKGFVFEKLGS
ncbi:MAG: polysaccharide deacetylase family protein [Bacteroidota bacterium]